MHSAQATENPESGSRILTVKILTAPTTLCVPFHALNSQCEVLIFGTHIGVAFYCSTTNFETILISTLGVKM